MRDALDTWWKKAEGKACIDYGLHMIVTDLGACGLEDMDDLVDEGVASFKLFMAYPNVLMVDDATIFKALSQTAKNGALICMHAENGSVDRRDHRSARWPRARPRPIYHALTRPPRAEAEAVHRAIAMAEIAGAPVYIVHLSSEDALNQVREARDRGVPAFAETCPQYLLLSIEELERPNFEGAKYVFTPPLRAKAPPAETLGRPQARSPAGGLHRPLPLLLRRPEDPRQRRFHQDSQRRPRHRESPPADVSLRRQRRQLSLNRFVELTSTTPARIFGMYPRKGEIAPGSDADIVIWDPGAALHHQRRDPPHARRLLHVRRLEVTGNARTVLSRGEVIVDAGQFLGKPGRGNYLQAHRRGGGAWK